MQPDDRTNSTKYNQNIDKKSPICFIWLIFCQLWPMSCVDLSVWGIFGRWTYMRVLGRNFLAVKGISVNPCCLVLVLGKL